MSDSPANPHEHTAALLAAVRAIVAPLARLAVARGVPYAVLEETLKQAVVAAAADAHPDVAPHRSVSRIATATGINRREVGRVLEARREGHAPAPRSPASEVFTRWLGHPDYRAADGQPLELPRLGPAPSFESLAQSVTRDVHPRSLLDELLRLRLAELDEDRDTVRAAREGFVPRGDQAITAVVAGAGEDDDCAAFERTEEHPTFLGDGQPGFLHELSFGAASGDCGAFEFAHLRSGDEFHRRPFSRIRAPPSRTLMSL